MKIIMLSGTQGSGKTTVQNALAIKLPASVIMNFADVLKEMEYAVLNILHMHIPARGIAKDGPLLQVLGTEWGRKTLGEDIWIRILQARIKKMEGIGVRQVIIGDCRFRNEFNAFPDAIRVRLWAPREIRKIRCSMWRENDQHPSEIDLNQYAVEGRFDLMLNTSELPVIDCVDSIIGFMEGFKGDRHNGYHGKGSTGEN